MTSELTKTSKFLSYVLRHKPEAIGIQLDPNGWVDVHELLNAANASGQDISRSKLEEVVFTKKMNRQYVHLSATIETAMTVGSRLGKPIVLSVNAGEMSKHGHEFYLSANGVWLTDTVPWKYVSEEGT